MSETHTNGSALLSIDEMLSAGNSFERVELPVEKSPGVKGCVYLRPLAAGAVVDFFTEGSIEITDGKATIINAGKQQDAMLRLMGRTVCDEHGVLLFNPSDIDTLRRLPIAIYNVLQERLTAAIAAGHDTGKALESAPDSTTNPQAPTVVVATANGSDTDSPSTSASGT